MKITKEGNLNKTKGYIKFGCNACGCEFIADNTEYDYEFNLHEGEYYKVICPCCKRTCSVLDIIKKYKNTIPEELVDEHSYTIEEATRVLISCGILDADGNIEEAYKDILVKQ